MRVQYLGLFVVTIALSVRHFVECNIRINVDITDYVNKHDRKSNGLQCESFFSDLCDPVFEICLGKYPNRCNFISYKTKAYANQKRINNIFSGNAISYNFPKKLFLRVSVHDRDFLRAPEHIATFKRTIVVVNRKPISVEIKVNRWWGTSVKAKLTFDCTKDYYGPMCNQHCIQKSRNYKCDPDTGKKICILGCQRGGKCIWMNTKFQCLCPKGWKGTYCHIPDRYTTPSPKPTFPSSLQDNDWPAIDSDIWKWWDEVDTDWNPETSNWDSWMTKKWHPFSPTLKWNWYPHTPRWRWWLTVPPRYRNTPRWRGRRTQTRNPSTPRWRWWATVPTRYPNTPRWRGRRTRNRNPSTPSRNQPRLWNWSTTPKYHFIECSTRHWHFTTPRRWQRPRTRYWHFTTPRRWQRPRTRHWHFTTPRWQRPRTRHWHFTTPRWRHWHFSTPRRWQRPRTRHWHFSTPRRWQRPRTRHWHFTTPRWRHWPFSTPRWRRLRPPTPPTTKENKGFKAVHGKQQQVTSKQRYLIIGIGLVVLTLLLAFLTFFVWKQRRKTKIRVLETEARQNILYYPNRCDSIDSHSSFYERGMLLGFDTMERSTDEGKRDATSIAGRTEYEYVQ